MEIDLRLRIGFSVLGRRVLVRVKINIGDAIDPNEVK